MIKASVIHHADFSRDFPSSAEVAIGMDASIEALSDKALNAWHGALLSGTALVAQAATDALPLDDRIARPASEWRSSRAIRGSSKLRMREGQQRDVLPYCQQCLTKCSGSKECLEDLPCCDCQACRQGWSDDKYPWSALVGNQCEAACARCENNVAYRKSDVAALHRGPSTQAQWQQALRENTAASWAKGACAASRHNSSNSQHLEEYVNGQILCMAAAFGESRADYCACAQGDQTSCSLHRNALQSSDLKRLTLGSHGYGHAGEIAERILAGNPGGWFCSGGPKAFGGLGARLFAPDLDADLRGVVAHLLKDWAPNRLAALEQAPQNNANEEVKSFGAVEVDRLADELLRSKNAELSKINSISWDSDNMRMHLVSQTAALTNVSDACIASLVICNADPECAKTAERISSAASLAGVVEETFQACNHKVSLFMSLRVSSECPSRLPAAAIQGARVELQHLPEAELCANVPRIKQDVVKYMLPTVVSSISDSNLADASTSHVALPAACVAAQQRCGSSARCHAGVEAMAQQHGSIDGMLAETEKLCDDKQSMLWALDVSAECGGLLPRRESRQSREAAANEPQSTLCPQMQRLTTVMSILLRPVPDPDCEAARQECDGDHRCKAAQDEAAAAGGSSLAVLDETLKLRNHRDSFMTSLRTTVECHENMPEKDIRQAYAHLDSVGEVAFSEEARKVGEELRAKIAPLIATVPVPCAQAHRRCGANERCRQSKVAAASLGGASAAEAVEEALGLCDDQTAMIAALDVAAECPVGISQTPMRFLRGALGNTSALALCTEALKVAPLLGEVNAPADGESLLSPTALRRAEEKATEHKLAELSTQMARLLLTTFDVAPRDAHLNAVEAAAMLKAPGLVRDVALGLDPSSFDADHNKLVSEAELRVGLVTKMEPMLQSVWESW